MKLWLTGIISNWSAMNTHLLNGLFPSPTYIFAEEEGKREQDPWLYSFLSQIPCHFTPDHLCGFCFVFNSHQFVREEEILFLALFCSQRSWCYLLPIVLPSIRFGSGWDEDVHPVRLLALWTTVFALRCNLRNGLRYFKYF